MEGLPLLPGYSFRDPTITDFRLSHQYDFRNGFCYPCPANIGTESRPLDIEDTHLHCVGPIKFDPSLIYGHVKKYPQTRFVPHYALYDRVRLTFRAFFKQTVSQSQLEDYRIRQVNIIYFVEDDTITVLEPEVVNSGLQQGRLVRRNRIKKTTPGHFWHWKDFNIGIDVMMYGIVYHIVDCDSFTKEYLQSQGIMMNDPEEIPSDPYTFQRQLKTKPNTPETKVADDKFRRFLEYDGKVLRFFAVWDDPGSWGGELRPYTIYYYLADDTVEVHEDHKKNNGHDPFPLLLRKMKLPKDWKAIPVDFPSVAMEVSEKKDTSYYTAKDILVGEIIFILGRRFLVYDADEFTRKYFKEVLNITQKDSIDVSKKVLPPPVAPVAPYLGFGSPEDSLQSCLVITTLKPPKKNVVQYVINIGKYLRYEAVMDWVHPEDKDRKFMFSYSLSDCSITITEIPRRNSGFTQKTYLRSTRIPKLGSNWDDPQYYSPLDFTIGAVVTVFTQRFVITGADLFVYHFMQSNPEKFPQAIIDNIRNYMIQMGHLKEENTDSACNIEQEHEKSFAHI